jgi:ubiquitin-like protein ATG12
MIRSVLIAAESKSLLFYLKLLEKFPDCGLVTVSFRPISSAPPLKQSKFKVSTSQPFSTVVRSLRKKLRLKESESLFCYIGSCFSPGLDEGVGNLWRCFRTGEELVVGYAIAQAFG